MKLWLVRDHDGYLYICVGNEPPPLTSGGMPLGANLDLYIAGDADIDAALSPLCPTPGLPVEIEVKAVAR